MRTKMTKWLDMNTLKPKFGIAVQARGKWYQAAHGDKLLVFDTEEACQAKRKELRREPAI